MRRPRRASDPEDLLARMKREVRRAERERWQRSLSLQLAAWGVRAPVPEHAFDPERRFRFDFAYPDLWLAVEIEGGVWRPGGGAHQRAVRFLSDMEKYNRAVEAGWRLLRFSGADVESGRAAQVIARVVDRETPRYVRRRREPDEKAR